MEISNNIERALIPGKPLTPQSRPLVRVHQEGRLLPGRLGEFVCRLDLLEAGVMVRGERVKVGDTFDHLVCTEGDGPAPLCLSGEQRGASTILNPKTLNPNPTLNPKP